jgi:hypothetical protein
LGWRLSTVHEEQRWQADIRSLLATEPQDALPAEAKVAIAEGKTIWVSWVDQETIRWAPLHPEIAAKLIDSKSRALAVPADSKHRTWQWQPKHNKAGNHRLYRLQTPRTRFWMKIYPEQPGTEYLVTALDRRLGINGTPPQQLLALHHAPLHMPDGTQEGMQIEQSAVLLTKHVAESEYNLHQVSKRNPQQLDQLDFVSFSKTLLRVLLTNPEDDKGDDYFLLPIADSNKYQLIRIDNERAFLPVTHLTNGWVGKREELQVKSILYCLDQMLLPWSHDLRTVELLDDLHRLQPWELIPDLLQDIARQQQCWETLFPADSVKQHACLQDPWMSLPVFMLPKKLETALLNRLTSLQTVLRLLKPQDITGLKLLEVVQPKLAQHYNLTLFQGKLADHPRQPQANVWKRFNQVAGRYYHQSFAKVSSVSPPTDYQTSTQSGPLVYSRQLSIALPELPETKQERDALMDFAQSIWSRQVHSIKQALEGAQAWQHIQLEEVRRGLLALEAKARIQFRWLRARLQQQLLDQLWSKPDASLSVKQQHFLLTTLAGAQCHNLDFRPFKTILTNELLLPILRNADKQILKLNLSNCTQLTSDILQAIELYCPYLKRLRINDQTNWKNIYVGNFAELTTLECNRATVLTDIRFGQLPKLKKLSLADATKLEVLGNQGYWISWLTASTYDRTAFTYTYAWPLPQLQQLNTQNCVLLQVVHIQVNNPQTLTWQRQGCTALKVPSIFSGTPKLPGWLVKVLKAKPPLITLDLSRDIIGDVGAQALAEALKAKPSLTALYLESNRIGDTGAQALADALKAKPPLAALDLSDNRIGDTGAQALADALKLNPPLAALKLGSNYISGHDIVMTNLIGTAGAQALADALATNMTLTNLEIYGSGIPAATQATINVYLAHNQTLVGRLLAAITAYQYDKVTTLLEQGVSVNQVITDKIDPENKGYTPLMVAVQTGDSAMVATVLAQTFNYFLLSETPKDNLIFPNQTALQIAIQLHKQTPAKAAAFTSIIRQLINAYIKHGFAVPSYGTAWLEEFGHLPVEAKSISLSASLTPSVSSSSSTTMSSSPLNPSSNSEAIRARHAVPIQVTAEESDSEDDDLTDSKTHQSVTASQTTSSSSSTSTSSFFQPAPRSQPVETKETKQIVAEQKGVSENQKAQQRLGAKPPSEELDTLEDNEVTLQVEQIESITTFEH